MVILKLAERGQSGVVYPPHNDFKSALLKLNFSHINSNFRIGFLLRSKMASVNAIIA